MRFDRVLLIHPFYSSKANAIPVLPSGLGYLAERLKENEIEYDILDMALGYSLNAVKRKIKTFRPDLIGFSMMTYRYKRIYETINEIKKSFPQIKIVCGGPHISNFKEKFLLECPGADYGITFEGEFSLLDLVKGAPLENIQGLIYRKDERIIYTGDRAFIEDLDKIPFPKYEKFELKKYRLGIGIVTSRGCPYSCTYCSCHLLGKQIRFVKPENVALEIEYWYEQGFKEFGIQEDNPTFDKQRMYNLCDEIEKLGHNDVMLMCGNGVRADRVDRDLLLRMKEVGFKRLAFGVEAGNDIILSNIKKGLSIRAIEQAISTACELGFYVSLFFLVGSPGERVEDVDDSIALALKYPICDVRFNNLVPIPGTALFKWVEKNHYFLMSPEEYLNIELPPQMTNSPMFETPEFPANDRMKMLIKTKKIELLVRRRTLEKSLPNFLRINKIIALLYTTEFSRKFENWLMSFEYIRNTIGRLRMWIRKYIYART